MKNLSLNAKILLIVSVLIAGGTLISFFSLKRMGEVDEIVTDITSIYVKRDQTAADMLDSARQYAIQNKNILQETDPENAEKLSKDLDSIRANVYGKADEYKKNRFTRRYRSREQLFG